jgi:PAS domain S-box-containing protein
MKPTKSNKKLDSSDLKKSLPGGQIPDTERKNIENSNEKLLFDITRAKLEWEKTFDNVNELIILVDMDLNIIRCNRSFSEFAQIPIRELIGKKFNEFLSTDSHHLANEITEGRTEIRTKSGRWLYLSFNPIVNDEGKLIHSVLIGSDITDVKNIQQKLMESESELKKRVKELEKFYDIAVGRELRIKQLKNEIRKLDNEVAQYKSVLKNTQD